tara:strand:+ start:3344 stop:3532 length:189 start_codon:yes stop_codon:yes gene_type:complete
MEQDMTIEEAEDILMYEDPPKKNRAWSATKWVTRSFLSMCILFVNFVTISFFIMLGLLFIIG